MAKHRNSGYRAHIYVATLRLGCRARIATCRDEVFEAEAHTG